MALSDSEELELLELEEAEYQSSKNKPTSLKDAIPASQAAGPSKLESAVRGVGQGASAGFWDELAGAGEAIGQSIGLKGLGTDLKDYDQFGLTTPLALDPDRSFGDVYREARDKWRGEDKAAKKENPMSYGAGELTGMVASPLNKVAAPLSMAKSGALLSGLNALGNNDSDLTVPNLQNYKDAALDTAIGTGTGLVLGKTLDVASPYVDKAAKWASNKAGDAADRLAARALGAERGTLKKLGPDKVYAAGRQALDEGVLSPLASTDDLIARNTANKKMGWDKMDEAFSAVDDAGASKFNPLNVATDVEKELGSFYRSPINKGETAQLENTLESILMRGEGNIPLKEAHVLKKEIDKVANWKSPNPTPKELIARDATKIINDHIDEAVASGADVIAGKGLTETLNKGRELYGRGKTTQELLKNKLAREQGNKFFGLTDSIVGAGALGYGGYTDDWKTAGSVFAGKKALEKYGAQNAALLANKVSKSLLNSPNFASLYSKSPQAFNGVVQKLVQKMVPEKKQEVKPFDTSSLIQGAQGTKYAQVLQNAAQRGDKAVSAAHFILQQKDPEYRKAVMGTEEEQN